MKLCELVIKDLRSPHLVLACLMLHTFFYENLKHGAAITVGIDFSGNYLKQQTMNSINKQQPEGNFENLSQAEAQAKIKALIEKAKNTCFFCTNIKTGEAFSTRPMSVQKIEEDGTLWFLSAIDSHQNQHLLHDPAVQLLFKGSDYSDFLSLYGNAVVSRDEQKIEELWKPVLKTWFTEGKGDPRITVLQFTPEHGYYWDTKHAQIVAFAKQLIGAAIGKTLDDSIEGNLHP